MEKIYYLCKDSMYLRKIMPKILTNILYLTICAILLPLLLGCDRHSDLGKAPEVRDYILNKDISGILPEVEDEIMSIDSLTLITDTDCESLYQHINALTYKLHYTGNNADAVVVLRSVLEILESESVPTDRDKRQILTIYIRLGATFVEMGMLDLGLDYYSKGIELCDKPEYDRIKAMLYNNIGIVYGQCGVFDKAEEYLNKALEIDLRENVHHETFLNYGNLSELYALQDKIDQALEASQRSLDYIDQNKHPDQLASMRVQQGVLYGRLEQNDVAMSRFNIGLAQYKDLGDVRGMVSAYLNISKIYLKTGYPDSALSYANEALSKCREFGRNEDMVATLKTLSQIYGDKKEYEKANRLLLETVSINDSLQTAERRLRLTNLDDINVKLNDTAISTRAAKSTWAYVMIVVLVVVLSFILQLNFSQKKEREALEAEYVRQANLHDEDLSKVNRELTSLSLEKIRQQEALTDVCESLRQVLLELNPRETAKRENIRSLTNRLSQLCTSNADDEFKLFFERVHPDFYKTLAERYPELTARDMRLCAFLHLGLDTKEIASLTYREVRSVESARNRLRKKLGLAVNDDLTAFLRSL